VNKKHLFFLLLVIISVSAITVPALASLQAQETPLAAGGMAYELNPDSQGILWVSDANAGEIWAFDSISGAYTVYPVGGGPSDARSNGAGTAWWADFSSNQLSRMSTGNNQVTTWLITGSTGLLGTALDSSGEVWASDYNASYLYQLDPATNELCKYTIPDFGVGEYLLLEGGSIWFGDYVNERILRLEGTTFTWWDLPTGSYPRDLALDGSGQVWWTDVSNGYIGRLDAVAGSITTFTPPTSGAPQMLQIVKDRVWYSQQGPGQLVTLDPAIASGSTTSVTSGSQATSPACGELLPQAPVDINPIIGQAAWGGQTYQTELEGAGWTIYQMPVNSAPYGVAVTEQIWLVDQGRQILASVSQSKSTYLPLIFRQ
jgi:streptogramin lyase